MNKDKDKLIQKAIEWYNKKYPMRTFGFREEWVNHIKQLASDAVALHLSIVEQENICYKRKNHDTIMKVRITSCSSVNSWYADKTGLTFNVNVAMYSKQEYILPESNKLIKKSDCVIIDY